MLVGDRHRDGGPLTSLCGRQRECATLDGLLDRVRGGRSAVLVVRGEPGIGKTALLRYLTDRAVGFTVARCVGVESEMELAFTGLHDLCTPLLSCLDALVEPQRQALSVALGLASGEPPESFLVALAALNLLAQAAEDRPLLCIVDDVQWLDQATAQVLGFVGRRLLAEPVGLVFAARTTTASEDPLAGLPDLRLSGLDEQSARALLASVTTARLDESVRRRILEEAHGNPLALRELGVVDFAGGFAMPDSRQRSASHRGPVPDAAARFAAGNPTVAAGCRGRSGRGPGAAGARGSRAEPGRSTRLSWRSMRGCWTSVRGYGFGIPYCARPCMGPPRSTSSGRRMPRSPKRPTRDVTRTGGPGIAPPRRVLPMRSWPPS